MSTQASKLWDQLEHACTRCEHIGYEHSDKFGGCMHWDARNQGAGYCDCDGFRTVKLEFPREERVVRWANSRAYDAARGNQNGRKDKDKDYGLEHR
jgi:hypothetical protein